MARHNEIGRIGEDLASEFIVSRGFTIVERNYLRKWGEIDLVARETTQKIHFIEVKSVSYETKGDLGWSVTHETWRPEDKVHRSKQDRMKRAIQTWLIDHNFDESWQIDVITVRLVPCEKYAYVEMLENLIFE